MRELIMSLFIVFFVSCTKEGAVVTVEGRVYNPLTGEGAEGIEVKLIRDKVGGAPGAQSAGTTAEDISVTDENGIYNLNGVLGREVRYYVDGNKYHSIGVGNNSITGDPTYSGRIGIKAGKHNKVDFWVVPYSNSKLIINNVNCSGEDDKMVLYRQDEIGSLSGVGWEHVGCVYWESPGGSDGAPAGYSRVPMGKRYYRWEVTRNGITEIFYDTIYYPAGDYVTYEIAY